MQPVDARGHESAGATESAGVKQGGVSRLLESNTWMRPAGVTLLVDTVGVLPVLLTGALAVQLRPDLDLNPGSLGLVYAAYFAAAALLSAPLGRLSERTGPEPALRIGTAVYVVALGGIALVATTWQMLLGFLVVAGLGTAYSRAAGSLLVARAVQPGRQGLAFGIKHCSIPVASLLAGLSVPAIALTLGWRWAYAAGALLSLAVIATIPRGRRRASRPSTSSEEVDLAYPLLIALSIAFAMGSAAASSLGAYTVSTAVAAGMAEGPAGTLVAFGSVIGLLSRILVGHWTDHRTGNQLDVVGGMLVLGAIAFGLLALGRPAVLLFAVPFSFATGWAWLGSFNLAMIRLNPIAPGAAVGITQTGAFVGAIVGPIALGQLAHHISYSAAWLAAGASSLAAAAGILFMGGFAWGGPRLERPSASADT